jgi:hypothetical protein
MISRAMLNAKRDYESDIDRKMYQFKKDMQDQFANNNV